LNSHDRNFLSIIDILDIFAEKHSFQDLRDEFFFGTVNPLNTTINTTANAQAIQSIANQTQTLRIGSRISSDKLSGKEEDSEEWFTLFERLSEDQKITKLSRFIGWTL
jgi:hypothetical protein